MNGQRRRSSGGGRDGGRSRHGEGRVGVAKEGVGKEGVGEEGDGARKCCGGGREGVGEEGVGEEEVGEEREDVGRGACNVQHLQFEMPKIWKINPLLARNGMMRSRGDLPMERGTERNPDL